MATVDSLEIQISAQAKSANAAIDNLVGKLETLSVSLGKLNTGNLNSLAAGVKTLSGGMKGLEGIKKTDFNRLANGIERLAKIDGNQLKNISDGLNPLAGSVRQLSTTNFDTKGLSGFVNSMTRLANANFEKLGSSVILFANTLSNEMKRIGDISFNPEGLNDVINVVGKLGSKSGIAGTENLYKIKNNLVEFIDGLNKIGSVNFNMDGLDKVISGIRKLGGDTATKAAANLKPIKEQLLKFISGLNGIKSLTFDTTNISNLIISISRLGGVASERAIKNLPNLTIELERLIKMLSTAPKVSQNIINMTNALAKLARTGASAGKAADSLGKSFSAASNLSNIFRKRLSSLASGMSGIRGISLRASKGIHSFSNALSTLLPIGGLVGAFQAIKKSMDISSDLTEVQNVVDVTFGNMAYKVKEFAKISIEQFGMSELTLKEVASRFQAIGSAMNIDTSSIENANKFLNKSTDGYVGLSKSMSDVSLNLTKLTADMASFYNLEQEDVAEDLEAIFTGQTRPLRTYGLDLTQATLEEWALKQGLDADMQSMSQAEKTMLRYRYVLANTGAAQGDFARTANTWANQTRILKQNFEQLAATIGGVLINALKPLVSALNIAMGYINEFAKTVSSALGKIFGWTYEESGGAAGSLADDMEDVADATDDATASQKKFNKQLQAFDELNNLTSSQDKDKSSGSGTGAGDASALGKWTQGTSMIKQFESEIDSLYKLGEYIGNALTKAMNSIKWEDVYKKAQGFGTGLANFLNGLISPELFSALGKTIAGALNTALHFLNSFGETFDWEDFGDSIAAGINSFFETFDFKLLTDTFNVWANGLLTTAIHAVEGVKWKKVAQAIADTISGIDAKGISWNIGKLVNSLANAFYTLVSNKETWINLGQKIADGINGFFAGMNNVDKNTGLTGWQALGKSISETISGIATSLTMAFDDEELWNNVGQGIADFMGGIDFAGVTWNLINLARGVCSAAADAISNFVEEGPLKDLGTAIVTLIGLAKITGLADKLSGLFTTALAGKNLTLGKVALGLGLGLATFHLIDSEDDFKSKVMGPVSAALTAYTFTGSMKFGLKAAVISFAWAEGFDFGKYIGEKLSKAIEQEDLDGYRYDFKFSDLFTYSPEEWQQGLFDLFDDLGIDIMVADILSGNFKFHIPFTDIDLPPVKDVIKTIGDWFKCIFQNPWKETEALTSGIDVGNDLANGILQGMADALVYPAQFLYNLIVKPVKEALGIHSPSTVFKELGKYCIDGFVEGIKDFATKFKTSIQNAWNTVKTWWSSNVKLPKINLPTIANIKEGIKKKWEKARDWWNDKVKLPKINLPTIADIKEGIKKKWNTAKEWWDKHVKLPKLNLDFKFSTDSIKAAINTAIGWINKYIIKSINALKIEIPKIEVAGKKVFGGKTIGFNVPDIPTFATGGFPEDGWFRASKGEYFGQFDDGTSYIANNNQITDGISDGVYNALNPVLTSLVNAINTMNVSNGNGDIVVEIDGEGVFRAVREKDSEYRKRTGKGAFVY